MKKLWMMLLLLGSMALTTRSMAQQRVTFYYYPDANVYYNPHTHEYAYSDNDSWRYGTDLPSTYHLNKRFVTVYGNSDRDEIWRDNAMHHDKYRDVSKREVKREYRHAKKEAKEEVKHEIKHEKKEEKREVKRGDD